MEGSLRERWALVPGLLMLWVSLATAQNYQITFTVQEELPVNSFIGDIMDTPQFGTEIPAEDLGSIRFNFLQQNHIKTFLTLNETSGVIWNAMKLDRESNNLCDTHSPCTLTFDIAVRSIRSQSSFFAIVTVTLVVEDINDNAPVFPSKTIIRNISEAMGVGTTFQIDSASDLDAGIFSVQDYDIGKQDGDFELDVLRKLDGRFDVKLLVNSALDREVKDTYSVVIIAMDGGTPRRFGAVSVNITVTDENDNPPVFTRTGYNVTVWENVTVDTTILEIRATDADIGKNGKVVYRFSPNQLDPSVLEFFSIDSDSGDLKVIKNLVYEKETSSQIIVEASDMGDQPHVSQVIVNVNVLDVGNSKPSITVNLLSPGNSMIKNISEDATRGTFVAHIGVEDKDTGDNGRVFCHISSNKFKLQVFNSRGYKVVVNGNLDRETQDMYTIVVSCRDHGSPAKSSSAQFMVSITDVNDNPPIFTQSTYTGTWPENKQEFSPFITVKAIDKDLGKNGRIHYSINRSLEHRFWIDEDSGQVRADQIFDRETDAEISFMVTATDDGNPRLSSSARVMVIIEDRNDHAPVIQEPKELSVTENLNSDTLVGRLKAFDADEGDNAKVMFLMKPEYENNDKIPFVVFTDGSIKTNRQLDREERERYNFTVVVFDQGSPRLSSMSDIIVTVGDANDNSPLVTFPSEDNCTVTVLSNIKPGTKLAQIEADDLDEGMNKVTSYSITSGNDDDLFVVDATRGGIYLSKAVTSKENRSYHLVVTVRDGGDRTASADLKIIIRSSNETALASTGDDEGNTNIIIVIVVVLVTLVLSLAMIMVICFLRRFDSQHKAKIRDGRVLEASNEKIPSCYRDPQTGGQTLTYDPIPTINKKKEVSFDLEEPIVNNNRDGSVLNTSSISVVSEQESDQPLHLEDGVPDSQGRQLTQIQLLQYHQAMLESQTQAWLQSQDLVEQESESFEVTLPDDKYSDTSGEVTASDSGKGGSEDDLPNNNIRGTDRKFKPPGVPQVKMKTHYVAPEYREQGCSLQHKARGLSSGLEDPRFINCTPEGSTEDLRYHPSTSNLSHSTPRPNSRAAQYYPQSYVPHSPLDTMVEARDWDSASYV